MRSLPDYIRHWSAASLIAAVRCYQAVVRPITAGSCRYVPGCSEYFVEAVRVHGPWHGTVLGVKRILRCRPGGGWGYDPVPPPVQLAATTGNGSNGKTTDATTKRMPR